MDKMKPTILECDYDIKDNPPYLLLKRFKDDEVVFQWIQGYTPLTTVRQNVLKNWTSF